MNENMMEALEEQRNEEVAGDHERAHAKAEAWDEPIVQKMLGGDYEKFFYLNDEGQDVRELASIAEAQVDAEREAEDERAHKHYWDALHTNN